jgi:hypothetical protein
MALLPALDVAAALLVIAGTAKLRDPRPARTVLRSGVAPVYAAALLEIAVGIGCLVHPVLPFELGAAALYTLFAAIVALQLRSGQTLASCGCLGAIEVVPSRIHVAFNLAVATAVSAAAATSPPALCDVVVASPLAGLVMCVGILAAVRLAVAAFSDLPQLAPLGGWST